MERKASGLTRWARVVTILALAGALPPTPAAVAAEPSPTWRGWIAYEYDLIPNPALVKGRNYDRMVEVVTAPPSAPGEAQVGAWRASSYQLQVENCVGLPGTTGGELAATTGTGPNTWSFYPYQTEPTPWIAWKTHQTGDFAFDGVVESCDGTVKPSLGPRRHGLGLEFAAAPGAYENPPTTVSFAADLSTLPNDDGRYSLYSTARYVVCMTTSTADRDGDSLPDVVDLNPGAPGATLDLGDPAGTGQWSIPIPKYYSEAPTQAEQGLPSCPAGRTGVVDTDGDGIADAEDNCPTTPGPARNDGCPDLDFNWSVNDRMIDDNSDGVLDRFYLKGMLSERLEKDQPVMVRLDACPAEGVTWLIDGQPAGQVGCKISALMQEGPHEVVAKTASGSTKKTIRPQHYVVVGMGDSYGSGEGVPWKADRNNRRDPATWDDTACHRSRYSAQAQAAVALEHSDDKSAVTFVHVACSGAVSKNLYKAQKNPPGDKGGKVAPQVTAAAKVLQGNTVDAVLLSIGGNDVRFSGIIKTCIAKDKCPKKPSLSEDSKKEKGKVRLHHEIQAYLKDLRFEYDKAERALERLGVPSSHVLQSEYPALGQNEKGKYCNGAIADEEFKWATEVVQTGRKDTSYRLDFLGNFDDGTVKVSADGLNRQIRANENRGWVPVTGLFKASKKHGYCARDSWVTSLKRSVWNQGNPTGGFHPNYEGQAAFGEIIGKKLVATLSE